MVGVMPVDMDDFLKGMNGENADPLVGAALNCGLMQTILPPAWIIVSSTIVTFAPPLRPRDELEPRRLSGFPRPSAANHLICGSSHGSPTSRRRRRLGVSVPPGSVFLLSSADARRAGNRTSSSGAQISVSAVTAPPSNGRRKLRV